MWLRIFVVGIVSLYLIERSLIATSNPVYFPSAILFGAFLVPVTFTVYLYETLGDWDVPLPPIGMCFLWGGAMGTVIAGVLEYDVLQGLGVFALLGVGFIEESAKMIFPFIFFLIGRCRSETAGIVFGVASAMGFAALETMGYAFVVLLESQGSLGALDEVLLVRGLVSPAGHAAWTGLICAVLFRERLRAGRAALNARIVGAFATAVVLHALWDAANSLRGTTFIGFLSIELASLAIAIVSLTLLIRKIRDARRAGGPPRHRVA